MSALKQHSAETSDAFAARVVAWALYSHERGEWNDRMPPWSGASNSRKLPYEYRAEAVLRALIDAELLP